MQPFIFPKDSSGEPLQLRIKLKEIIPTITGTIGNKRVISPQGILVDWLATGGVVAGEKTLIAPPRLVRIPIASP